MAELLWYHYLLIALIFVWSGFVRSGLGFGGAALSLPFLLLIDNNPLIFLPIIAIHLLVFSSSTVVISAINNRNIGGTSTPFGAGINWHYLRYALLIMIIPKLLGVFGLITLPATLMSSIIFTIVSIYAIGYILNRPFRSNSKTIDALFLMLGGYISGSSLIGAPLIIAVFANHVDKHQLRDTLFVLWFILVTIKMTAFITVGIDLQLIHQLWLLPCATIGHLIGLRFHKKMLTADSPLFFRVLGTALLVISMIGLVKGLL
ncbi:TSUP family transporter [Sedimenticola selenatireducens]|uniref:Probable membrane transporter protein n=1 Tax=Sedimenticola selenatireducens TaxID=191960 RepID=A0A558DVT2_9GAMM|nr:TSUP family transporter [Sedimenticola selenatireducens]TVO77841.1 TSUP family transporter [Sedimenticola selenatireducens]TVT65146.1 MAG: TSUP family transporter [Sedimenticola selenatireducens]